jgi:hypothetical protein
VIEALAGQGHSAKACCRMLGVADLVLDIYRASNGTYGKRRITAELRLGYGMTVNQKAVRAAMRRLVGELKPCFSTPIPVSTASSPNIAFDVALYHLPASKAFGSPSMVASVVSKLADSATSWLISTDALVIEKVNGPKLSAVAFYSK